MVATITYKNVVFTNNSTSALSGTKTIEMTTDGEVLIIIYGWICNITRCNMYNNNMTKRVGERE